MLPSQSLSFHARFLQTWNPTLSVSDDGLNAYIDFPSGQIDNFIALEVHPLYPSIKAQFLADASKLKELAHAYVTCKYDDALDVFTQKLDAPEESIQDTLLPLYRETRFQIHCLVRKLKRYQRTSEQASDLLPIISQNQIAMVLEECLTGIELCSAGIHSRFASSIDILEAAEGGLLGAIYETKKQLYQLFIQRFLFEIEREGAIDTRGGMEIHFYNALHNLYCGSLALPALNDPHAPINLTSEIITRYLSSAPLEVNEHRIVQEMARKWSEKFQFLFDEQGIRHWLSEGVDLNNITSESLVALDCQIFKPLNILLEAKKENSLNLWRLIEEKERDIFSFTRFYEKLWAWIAHTLLNEMPTVFSATCCSEENRQYIGSMSDLFFWVFDSEACFSKDKSCTFDNENHTSLQLQHLMSTEFSSWPSVTCLALLTQAVEQTLCPQKIAAFFLDPFISGELSKLELPIKCALSGILSEKTLKNKSVKNVMCEQISKHYAELKSSDPVSLKALSWILDTPLLETVLCELLQQGKDISQIIETLNTWQISSFSEQSMVILFSPLDCQRLFKQASELQQLEIMVKLIITGHCNALLSAENEAQTLFYRFVKAGHANGVHYLLGHCESIQVNEKDLHGLTALHFAAQNGHLECLKILLPISKVAEKDCDGWTSLHFAARYGHFGCVRELLKNKNVWLNETDSYGWRALHLAAKYGHIECVRELLKNRMIEINQKQNEGFSALHFAAKYGKLECLKELLKNKSIHINEKQINGLTALHLAVSSGYSECVRELLKNESILLNDKDAKGRTPLHWAAQSGKLECVRILLLAENIQVNKKNNEGRTPQYLAKKNGHLECVKLFDEYEKDKSKGKGNTSRFTFSWRK